MPKRGQTQPWKVRYQYPSQVTSSVIAKHHLRDAARDMVILRKRGATVTLQVREDDGLHDFSDEQIIEYLRKGWGRLYDSLINDIEGKVWEQTGEEED